MRKFVGVGGVVLTSAAMPALSCMFAMRTGVRAPLAVAVVIGLLWGLAIMNLDRWLVAASQRRDRWYQNLTAAVPRLLLALILGSVVSPPLVAWLFDGEIEAELYRVQLQKHYQYHLAQQSDSRFMVIPELGKRIALNRAVLDGTATAGAASGPTVAQLEAEYADLDRQHVAAQRQATCEFDGSCGSMRKGDGPAYRQELALVDELKGKRDAVKQRLDQARAKLTGQQRTNANTRKAAADQLAADQKKLDRLNALKRAEEEQFIASSRNDSGLLARLAALSQLANDNGTLRTAYLALLLFITSIEALPVLVKFLMNLGPPSVYDQIRAKAEASDREAADAVLLRVREINPVRVAGRIAQAAAWVLPAVDRVRYCDEFRSELYELAAADVSRWGQLMYAVRLMDRAWVLSAELRVSAARRVRS